MSNSQNISNKYFLKEYFNQFKSLIEPTNILFENLCSFAQSLKNMHSRGNKAIIVGNGGSAAIASHFSVDLTKNTSIRCMNFNEYDLITCFANDYGYEQWIEKAVELYGNKGDVLIAISSSGSSENILNGCHAAREKQFSKVFTFSGMKANNPLKQLGDINLWVNSKAYNHIENIHQFWLLAVVDLVIGKAEYSVNSDAS
jgi:D-sedoheptulose 7-phosphate isomerase